MENENSVAYISKINKIVPIEGADKIELAYVNDWSSIVQKGIHKEGDLVLCITTDAVIPNDYADHWGVKNYLRKGNRVRTIKLRGVYSECILIPKYDIGVNKRPSYHEGQDLMSALDISKYEPPEIIIMDSGGRKHKYHQNPNFHTYYKFPNIKNVPDIFDENDIVSVTRKIHGTNARYGIVKKNKLSLWDYVRRFFGVKWIDYEYVYGSHKVEKGSDSQGFYSTDVWKEVADEYKIKDKLWNFVKHYLSKEYIGDGIIIYGEIYGPGIQGEKYTYGLSTKSIVFFDIETNGTYESEGNLRGTLDMIGLPKLPELYYGKYNKDIIFNNFVKDQFINNTKVPHEGAVIKCSTGDRKKIAKMINPDYLIHAEKYDVPDSH